MMNSSGILLINKEAGCTSFHLVTLLRRLTKVSKIGHAGTLDPFATGVMVMLIGPEYTRQSSAFLHHDKQYKATLHLGIETDTYDIDGQITKKNASIPSLEQIQAAILPFQGEILQVPPMFSAKKVKGQKLYDLARKGIEIERAAAAVKTSILLLSYQYPHLEILVDCSKGTYIRSLAHDIGKALGIGAHLSSLTRTKSGPFSLSECFPQIALLDPKTDITPHLRTMKDFYV